MRPVNLSMGADLAQPWAAQAQLDGHGCRWREEAVSRTSALQALSDIDRAGAEFSKRPIAAYR